MLYTRSTNGDLKIHLQETVSSTRQMYDLSGRVKKHYHDIATVNFPDGFYRQLSATAVLSAGILRLAVRHAAS